MSTFASIVAGIGIGLTTSITAWLVTFVLLSLRVRVEDLNHGEADADWPAFKFRVVSRRRRRGLSDVNVHCALHIPHHQS